MARQELSTTTIEKLLDNNELPDNFDELSGRKQKEIIFNTVLATYKQLTENLNFKHKAVEAQKKLKKELKQNPTAMKLQQISKQLKETKTNEIILLERYNGMKKLAAALGFNEKVLAQIEE